MVHTACNMQTNEPCHKHSYVELPDNSLQHGEDPGRMRPRQDIAKPDTCHRGDAIVEKIPLMSRADGEREGIGVHQPEKIIDQLPPRGHEDIHGDAALYRVAGDELFGKNAPDHKNDNEPYHNDIDDHGRNAQCRTVHHKSREIMTKERHGGKDHVCDQYITIRFQDPEHDQVDDEG